MRLYLEDGTEFNDVVKMLLKKISELEQRIAELENKNDS